MQLTTMKWTLMRFMSEPTAAEKKAAEAAARHEAAVAIDANQNGSISMPELARYIDEKHAKVWALLALSLNLPEERCRDVAANVAFQMSKAVPYRTVEELSDLERDLEPSVAQLEGFMAFVKEPKGELEFFHRAVFATFDTDGNGYLDPQEIDAFLDVFYEAGSIFAGVRTHVLSS